MALKAPSGEWGRLEIPCIKVSLPIYLEVSEEKLQHGVVQITNTPLPGQGINKHSLLAGHRGLPGKVLLTHLDEVKEGECFYIRNKEETLVYEVYHIQTVSPESLQHLTAEEGRELVSIITCTPYGIYTNRLVVTGERIE